MQVSSSELNYLIWRYLQESGLTKSTLVFQNEAHADSLDASYSDVTPVGLLVNVFQKGIQYMQLESSLAPDGSRINPPPKFALFSTAVAASLQNPPQIQSPPASEVADKSTEEEAPELNSKKSIGLEVAEVSDGKESAVPAALAQPDQEDVEMADVCTTNKEVENIIESDSAEHAEVTDLPETEQSETTFEHQTLVETNQTEQSLRTHSSPMSSSSKKRHIDSSEPSNESKVELSPKAADAGNVDELKRPKTSHSPQPADIQPSTSKFRAAGEHINEEGKHITVKPHFKYLSAGPAQDCVWSPDGSLLAMSAGTLSASKVNLYKFTEQASTPSLQVEIEVDYIDVISSICLLDNMLGIGTYSGAAMIWSISNEGKESSLITKSTSFHKAPILSCSFVQVNEKVLFVTVDCVRRAAIWDTAVGLKSPLLKLGSDNQDHEEVGDYHNDILSDLAVLQKLQSVAITTASDGNVDIYDLQAILHSESKNASPSYSLKGHSDAVNVVVSTEDMLISGSQDKCVRVWNLSPASSNNDRNSISSKYVLEGHSTGVMALRVRDNVLVSGDLAGRLRVWDVTSGILLTKIEYNFPVFAFDISTMNDETTVVTGSKDGVINEWKIENVSSTDEERRDGIRSNAAPIEHEGGELGGITAISVNSSSKKIVVACRERSCVVYYV
ncbi:WD40-repeat-containing domain protein [Lipomyces oligophaga]|uniref:WD40-repeat-containing domain protein n=1 Tax=Lipomyces oligophaga TaxID=45792 RepID=UPI0034CD49B6